MTLFHQHTWKILEQHEQQSAFDRFAEQGGRSFRTYTTADSELWARRDVIVKARCECGAEKVYRV